MKRGKEGGGPESVGTNDWSWWRSMRGMVVGRVGAMRMSWLGSGVIVVVNTARAVTVADGVIVTVVRRTRHSCSDCGSDQGNLFYANVSIAPFRVNCFLLCTFNLVGRLSQSC